jgi:hypothetical protein
MFLMDLVRPPVVRPRAVHRRHLRSDEAASSIVSLDVEQAVSVNKPFMFDVHVDAEMRSPSTSS